MINTESLIADFIQVTKLAHVTISPEMICAEELPAPHRPPSSLPSGKMVVYVFAWRDQCLKVGYVGSKSQPRYTSQHYNPNSSNSNLAKSILKEREILGLAHLDKSNVGDWIKDHTDRVNFLLDDRAGVCVLGLLELFLQCRLGPRFEGFGSQK